MHLQILVSSVAAPRLDAGHDTRDSRELGGDKDLISAALRKLSREARQGWLGRASEVRGLAWAGLLGIRLDFCMSA